MNWPVTVAAYFEAGGWLQSRSPRFTPRADQIRMASAVAQTMETGGCLVVEAGTGVGKTYAYLLPALLSGKKTLISTATKNLQDQLFNRDLPDLCASLGVPIKTALLKGRSSYLCLQRMEQARAHLHNAYALRALAKVERWAQATQTGDLAEVAGLDERSPVLPWVTSTRDNCLGSECLHAKACHVNLARRDALAADVVVINHHLFFADLVIKESGVAQLLPMAETVIFDEAHQLNEVGIQFLGEELASNPLLELSRDALGAGLQWAKGMADWQDLSGSLEIAVRDWRLIWPEHVQSGKLRWLTQAPEHVTHQAWGTALSDIEKSLAALDAALAHCHELSPELLRLRERIAVMQTRIALFEKPMSSNRVRWVELSRGVRLVESPLEIGGWMQEKVWNRPDPEFSPEDEAAASSTCFIFTSATLGEEPTLKWFVQPMGLVQAQVLSLGSPFDYPKQAALFIPQAGPAPNQPHHSQFVAELACRCAQALGGRTLVLTTSLKALEHIGKHMTAHFDGNGVDILCQGHATKRELVQRFRTAGQAVDKRGAVLVASASFWEGVDIAGDALMCVLIDKLPFPMPSDPWVQARSEQLEAQGQSAFRDYSLPAAAVALKQGAGRLIRQETDKGLLVVCDTRLHGMSYGKRLKAALPPMRELADLAALEQYLAQLMPDQITKTSTTGDPNQAIHP